MIIGQIMTYPLDGFEFSVRTERCLEEMGIRTVFDLCRKTEEDLLAHRSFGRKSLREVKEALSIAGLELGEAAS